MKKNKLIVIISAVVCAVLAVATMAIAFTYDEHNHKVLSDARVYHVSNNGVYYTREYKDGCVKNFETEATFYDALMGARANDKVVLDEDITLQSELILTSYSLQTASPQGLKLDIDLDLNNHKLTTDVDGVNENSVFTLGANYGSINFSISNGKISTEDLLYIFKFENSAAVKNNITLNLNNVECEVSLDCATPLFAHNEACGVKVNANNSKFISKDLQQTGKHYGIGAFINDKEGEFNFDDCYFNGGDAMYVKQGKVNLTNCTLESHGLDVQPEHGSETFVAVGACLVGDTYTTSEGSTAYEININKCNMVRGTSTVMIYVAATAEDGIARVFNDQSEINVISCRFQEDPTTSTGYDIINYNNQTPVNDNGTWVVG